MLQSSILMQQNRTAHYQLFCHVSERSLHFLALKTSAVLTQSASTGYSQHHSSGSSWNPPITCFLLLLSFPARSAKIKLKICYSEMQCSEGVCWFSSRVTGKQCNRLFAHNMSEIGIEDPLHSLQECLPTRYFTASPILFQAHFPFILSLWGLVR